MLRGPSLRERLDKMTLEKLYTQVGLSTLDIAERYGTTSPQVFKLMGEYSAYVERRSALTRLARPRTTQMQTNANL